MSSQQVVYLPFDDASHLSEMLAYAVNNGMAIRLWVDDGGLKYSIDRRTWSFPPLGTTVEP